jgi:predicted transcriptional regulator
MNPILRWFVPATGKELGPLEQEILEKLWRRGNATVRELVEHEPMTLAYTTVMTTLDRMYKKGLLSRAAEGRAFRYTPAFTPEQMYRSAALQGIRRLLDSSAGTALPLSCLVEALSEHDAQLLDDLHVLLERKRRELKKSGGNG